MDTRNNTEDGVIIRAGYALDENSLELLITLEIKEDSGWYCMLDFEEETHPDLLEIISKNKSLKSLIGVRVKLLPASSEHTTLAPIAISKGKLSTWIYKKGFDQNGRKKEGY